MNGHEPATKQDLADVRTELLGEIRNQVGDLSAQFGDLRAQFGDLRTQFGDLRTQFGDLRSAIRASEDRLIENMRDLQTESLKAFYGFVETTQVKFRIQEEQQAGVNRRLSVVEERLAEVERRLNMPPQSS